MTLIVILVFLAVFAVTVLLVVLFGAGAGKQQKQIQERLDSMSMAAQRGSQTEGLGILREELLSTLPVLNRWLGQLDLFPQVRRLISQAQVRWTLAGLMGSCIGAGVLAGVATYLRTAAWPLALMLGALASTIPVLYLLYKRSERFGKIEQGLPEALDLMVSAMRAGHSLISAIEMVAKQMPEPIAGEFRKCFEEQNFGLELREAMLNMAQRVPIHDIQMVVTAVLIQKETGGNLAEILDKVAQIIRDRFRLKRQVRVHTAQGRLTGWILSLLPVFLGMALYLINPTYMSRLWQDQTGLKLIYTAVILTVIGGLIIRKIVRIQV